MNMIIIYLISHVLKNIFKSKDLDYAIRESIELQHNMDNMLKHNNRWLNYPKRMKNTMDYLIDQICIGTESFGIDDDDINMSDMLI
jgi:hypothetical protein